jgi:hypothetical protein
MNKIRGLTSTLELLLGTGFFAVLIGSSDAQPQTAGVFETAPQLEASASVAVPGVEIRTDSDFYEPLTAYGRWEVVGSYGRCWIPGRVEADWRPYSEGYWQRTDAGWYWVSQEPWAWATYHYGRWDLSPRFGWYWVPQTQWAPAWVSWHSGGGYIGWAPLYPSNVRVISPRSYVFVEQRHFLEPVRRSELIVNNTTLINKTVTITNTKTVNNTFINEGPKTQVIETASGQKVQEVPSRELRRKQEAPIATRQRIPAPTLQKNAQTPVRSELQPRAGKAVAAPGTFPVEHSVNSDAPAALTPTGRLKDGQPAQARPATATPRSAAIKKPAAPQADKLLEKQRQPTKQSNVKIQPAVRENTGDRSK